MLPQHIQQQVKHNCVIIIVIVIVIIIIIIIITFIHGIYNYTYT